MESWSKHNTEIISRHLNQLLVETNCNLLFETKGGTRILEKAKAVLPPARDYKKNWSLASMLDYT